MTRKRIADSPGDEEAKLRELIEKAQELPGVSEALPLYNAWLRIELELRRVRAIRPTPVVTVCSSSIGE
jgi:hypothetical protein